MKEWQVVDGAETKSAPLSFAQERLWLLDQFESDSPAYNEPAAFLISGSLEEALLERSLNEVIRRHETLRTTFVQRDGEPVQIIVAEAPVELPVIELGQLPKGDRETQLLRRCTEEGQRLFDLTRGPLLRASLFRLGESEHVLLLVMHHSVTDTWSMGVLRHELTTLYDALVNRGPMPLPELPIQYGDFARAQREHLQGEVLEEQLAYWKDQLHGSPPELGLLTDWPRPVVRTFDGARRSFRVSKGTWESVPQSARPQREMHPVHDPLGRVPDAPVQIHGARRRCSGDSRRQPKPGVQGLDRFLRQHARPAH